MSEFELTYEHYAQTLTKSGLTPKPSGYFETREGYEACLMVYSVCAAYILERFNSDLQKVLALEDGMVCPHCGSQDYITLTDHEQLYHVALYECEDCGRTFGTPEFAEADEEEDDDEHA